MIEVLNLDEKGKTTREPVDDPLLTTVRDKIRDAGEALRTNKLPRLPGWDKQRADPATLSGCAASGPGADQRKMSATCVTF